MSLNFFDCWKTFNTCFDNGDLTAQTQLVGYKLLAIFNERMFPESLPLTDRELMSRTNIKSGQTIVEARRQLKNAGLIDFKSGKARPTVYRLTIKQDSSKNQASDKQESSKIENPYIRAREDVKTLDVKTNSIVQSTRERESSELDSALEYWDELKGGRLTFEHQSTLNALIHDKGVDWVKSAMKEAADVNSSPYGLRPKFLFGVIKRKANPQPLKGGDKNARKTATFDYGEEPDTSWIKPHS